MVLPVPWYQSRVFWTLRLYVSALLMKFHAAEEEQDADTKRARDELRDRPERSLAAILTKSTTDAAPIFCMTRPRCAFTVISLMPSSAPTCLLRSPDTTKAMTCRSR